MSDIELVEVLEQLRAELRRVGAPVAWNFRPGLKRQEIMKLSRRLPYQLPPDVVELFTWHDGADGDENDANSGGLDFVMGGQFHRLVDVIDRYELWRDTAEKCATPDSPVEWCWDSAALPVFPADLGTHCEWVALCGESTESGTPCGYWDVVEDGLVEVHSSLKAMIKHTSTLLAEGKLDFWPAQGLVETDGEIVQVVRLWPGRR